MPKIISLTVIDEKGNISTWKGAGRVMVAKTKAPVEKQMPSQWPELMYVYAHIVPTTHPK